MKEHYKIALSGLIVGAAVFLTINFIGCSTTAEEKIISENIEQINEEKHMEHSCCSEEEIEAYTDNSIYQLDSDWITQSGDKVNLGSLKGKPVVLTMFFASCTYACPILIHDMKKIESSLEDKSGYRFVLVSIDPERDTPEVLMNLAKNNSLDSKRWTLLTSERDDIMELAALLGFKYKKETNGEYSHSNLITLLNEEGEIVYQHTGLNKSIANTLSTLNKLN